MAADVSVWLDTLLLIALAVLIGGFLFVTAIEGWRRWSERRRLRKALSPLDAARVAEESLRGLRRPRVYAPASAPRSHSGPNAEFKKIRQPFGVLLASSMSVKAANYR
jgi:hypothetical protein